MYTIKCNVTNNFIAGLLQDVSHGTSIFIHSSTGHLLQQRTNSPQGRLIHTCFLFPNVLYICIKIVLTGN